ncbi:MAG: DMT family transporter [Pseudomonadota bacterium]|nr:DMT family transporter [Pseudomonadota bacterium]
MSQQRQAYRYAFLAVLFWSTVATAFKITLRYLSVPEMLLCSSLVSTLILGVVLAGRGKLPLIRRCTRRDYLHSLVLGFLNPFLYYLILFEAYTLLPAQEAQPLNYTWPLMLVILAGLMGRERIDLPRIAMMLVSFVGILIIATRGDPLGFRVSNLPGALLAMGSSVVWASYWLGNLRDRREEEVKLFLNFFFGFLYALVLNLFLAGPGRLSLPGLAGAAYIGVFEMGITFFVWMKALALSRSAAQVTRLIYLSPFLSLVFIHFIGGETVRASSIFGLLFIVAGIFLQEWVGPRGKTGNE